ncbi:MAG: hypothetical protein WDA75_06100 [Candidatus Latescibacterota bacterium]|jgi:hypothetical protein
MYEAQKTPRKPSGDGPVRRRIRNRRSIAVGDTTSNRVQLSTPNTAVSGWCSSAAHESKARMDIGDRRGSNQTASSGLGRVSK